MTQTRLFEVVSAIVLVLTVVATPASSGETPIPSDADQVHAQSLVRDIYKEEYSQAKTAEQKLALAKKLLDKANQTKDDPAAHYVLLRVARDLAVQAGYADVAMTAITKMAEGFPVEAATMRVEAVKKTASAARSPTQCEMLLDCIPPLIDESVAANRIDDALELSRLALAVAREGKNRELVRTAMARHKDVQAIVESHERAQVALATLAQNPDDAEANLVAGNYFCFTLDDWPQGLPRLAKGSDAPLKELATRDLQGAETAAEQMRLGDDWWDRAETAEGLAAQRLRPRAVQWYQLASPQLTGLMKEKVSRRLAGAAQPSASPAPLSSKTATPVDLLRLIQPKRDAVLGEWRLSDDMLVSPEMRFARIMIPYTLPKQYDLEVVVKFVQGYGELNIGLVSDGNQFRIGFGSYDTWTGIDLIDGLPMRANGTGRSGRVLLPNKIAKILCSVRKDRVTVACDGQTLVDWKGGSQRLSLPTDWQLPKKNVGYLGSQRSMFQFLKVTLIPVTH